ncbi:MAG: hypothetical protein PHC75_09595 [Burkholderiales bacterium]|nr:hypothetical protein [Burkholderiales bacterium]
MAVRKISELNNLTTPKSDDLIPVVDLTENETKKITYDNLIGKDLSAINDELESLDINKADKTETDEMLEQLKSGWCKLIATFTFESFDSTVATAVINTDIDLTETIELGDRIKFTQDGAVKFGIVTAKTSTQLTLFLGTDYILEDKAITNVYFSHMKTPIGFNTNPDKWTVKTTSNSNVNQNNPTVNTWYNLGALKLDIPIGSWNVSYSCSIYSIREAEGTVDIQTTLSNSQNTQLSNEYSSYAYTKNILEFMQGTSRSFNLNLSSKTPYYLNAKTRISGITGIYFWGSYGATVIKAVCAYL